MWHKWVRHMDDEILLRWRLVVDSGRSYLALVGELDMSARPVLDRAFASLATDALPVTIDLDVTYRSYPRPVTRYLELAHTSLTAS